MKLDYFVSFAGGVEEIVESNNIRMIKQSHHLQFSVLHNTAAFEQHMQQLDDEKKIHQVIHLDSC